MQTVNKTVRAMTEPLPIATAEREKLARDLTTIVGKEAVLWKTYDLKLYEYDGSIEKHMPDAVVFPTTTAQVAQLVKYCNREKLYYTARGAGTGLSGGAIPIKGGVLIAFTRMNRILKVDPENLRAVVEPGVINLHLSDAVAPYGLYFVPDPSSQKACTLGGNVGENSGGPHTLLYGVTTNHTLGLEVVTPDGEIRHFGGNAPDSPGYDLCGLFVGSEGTLGLITKITLKLTPLPPAVKTFLAIYDSVEKCSNTVSSIIQQGVIPAALEMMDHMMIGAIEAATQVGYPTTTKAVLLIECEGFPPALEQQAKAIEEVCRKEGVLEFRTAKDEAEREALWKVRKGAFGAVGRMSSDYYVVDGVVPRSKLPAVLAAIGQISKKYGLAIANVFHAGDGNLHPLIMFDSNKPSELEKTLKAGEEIIKLCAEVGGTLSGEHGVGLEKRDMMCFIFNEGELAIMRLVRAAFDTEGLCNPEKLLPTPGRCSETHLQTDGKAKDKYVRPEIGEVW
ncbi:MAG: FAD-linked oxidase C-terminal domain-containing protein [Chloroflexota bacterium]